MNNKILSEIQSKLVARKDAFNDFGKYKYRSCESILAALKPILAEHGASVTFTDRITAVLDRVYLITTCTLKDADGNVIAETEAVAREALVKKGMDDSQCTGSASSYARKYALCGMFAIDDSSVDPDATNDHKEGDSLSPEEISLMRGASSKEELAEMCKHLTERGKNRAEVVKLYKEVHSKFSK